MVLLYLTVWECQGSAELAMRRKLRVLVKEELLCHLSKSHVTVGGSFENEVPLIQDAFLFYIVTSEHFESHSEDC